MTNFTPRESEVLSLAVGEALVKCDEVITGKATLASAKVACDAADAAREALIRAFERARPIGKRAKSCPWHDAIPSYKAECDTRLWINPAWARAKAASEGKLREHRESVERAADAKTRRLSPGVEEIDRRERRIGHALPQDIRDQIMRTVGSRDET